MALYELDDPGPLRSPALVVALEGWVNAGAAASTAAETLIASAATIAAFDPDALFDYRVTRPVVDFVEGVIEDVVWPHLDVRLRTFAERDLLILSGGEPNWQWRRLGREVGDLAVRLGVVEQVSLGGIPWAAPHTRPVAVVTTASSADRLAGSTDHPEGLLRVPGAAVSIIEHAVARRGIPTMGFWARVPNYLGSTFQNAAVALLQRLSQHLGVEVPMDELQTEAAEQLVQINAVAEARPEVMALVEQLEALVDTEEGVSGEQLAYEIERFLRQRDDDPSDGRP